MPAIVIKSLELTLLDEPPGEPANSPGRVIHQCKRAIVEGAPPRRVDGQCLAVVFT